MGRSWLVGNTLSLVSNIIILGIVHTHLSSARLLFYPTVGGDHILPTTREAEGISRHLSTDFSGK
jgi:hypothetical protein